MLSRQRFDDLLARFRSLKIALVGDLFLDRYLDLEPGVVEMSIETGLEAYQISQVRNFPGAMGTVLNNLAALGVAKLVPVTVIGDDGQAFDLMQEMRRLPVDDRHILRDPGRLTPTYTKPMRCQDDGQWVELNRLDLRTREPLRSATIDAVCEHLRSAFAECDGLVVLDQINEHNWGVIHDRVREYLIELHRSDPRKLIYVDSRRRLGEFQCGVLKGNRSEVLHAAGVTGDTKDDVVQALRTLAGRTDSSCFCTMGDEGMLVATAAGRIELVRGYPVAGPIDIVGAGDAATSGIVCSLLSGAAESEASVIGNLTASITIQQLGTTGTASTAQLQSRFDEWAQKGGGTAN